MMNIFQAKAKIWLVEDHERVDEYKRVQGLREDADKYITKVCLLAQDIYYKNQDQFGDKRIQFDMELLLDDSLDSVVEFLCKKDYDMDFRLYTLRFF